MDKSHLTVAEFILQCSLRINNSLNDDTILMQVSRMGYTKDELNVGHLLLEEVKELSIKCSRERGDVVGAYAQRNAEKNVTHQTFMKHRKLAKIAFKNNKEAIVALQLSGPVPQGIGDWVTQVKSFYTNLLSNNTWIEALAELGNGEEKLKIGLEQVSSVAKLNESILLEKGESQASTKERDDKIKELQTWVRDYEVIARIALEEHPQFLEKLGIVVKG
jgi:hypothetical protein